MAIAAYSAPMRARTPWDDRVRPARQLNRDADGKLLVGWDYRSKRRRELEEAIEQAIAALEAFDGDPDFEHQSEDEGGECNDEGWDGDREPDMGWATFGGNGPRIVTGLPGEIASHMLGDYVTLDHEVA